MVRFPLDRISVPRWVLFALLSFVNTSASEVYHFERWRENTGCGLYNYHLTVWKNSLLPVTEGLDMFGCEPRVRNTSE